jgi:predicted adenylyl cyclase CyaB
MPSNIEIKARVHDLAAFDARARALSDSPLQLIPQVDTFFIMPRGRLKLREFDSGMAQLIYYERPDEDGPKRSDYTIFETRDPETLKLLLSRALGVRGRVEKLRHLYLIGQTRIHLDEVKGLGCFMELEVVLQPGQSEQEGSEIAERLLLELGIDQQDLLESAYMDLLEQAG